MSGDIDYVRIMPAVAEKLWGAPKSRKQHEWRWGDSGSRVVRPLKGTFADHTGGGSISEGGVIDLITREVGLAGGEAVDWLAKNGFISRDDAKKERRNGKPKFERPLPPVEEDTREAPPPFDPDREETGPGHAAAPQEGPSARSGSITTPKQVVATYDYTDSQGSLLYQVQRWEWLENGNRKKSFAQRRPYDAEPGVWINGLTSGDYMRKGKGDNWGKYDADKAAKWGFNDRATFSSTNHALYRVEELRDAIATGEPVFIPEGEKKVEALISLGITATCNSGGAVNWRPEFAETFRDADVVVPIDNDEPGRKRGQAIAKDLYGVARRVRVLDFSEFEPTVPPKYDVADYIEAGNDAETLFDLVNKVKVWEPPKFKSRFSALSWADLDAPGPEHEWLVKGVLTRGERAMFAGPSGSGKSFLSIHIAMCIARGVDFFGKKSMRGGVVYQAGEGGRGVKKRLRAYRQHHGVDPKEPLPFILMPTPIDLYASEDQTDAFIAECKHWAATFDCPLELVVIDTFAAATPGADENSSKDVGPVLARCERIATSLNSAVLLVHHMNADGAKPRGHTSIGANIDSVIVIKKVDGKHDYSEKRRLIREATVAKMKDEEDAGKWQFVLKGVELGKDNDGDPITSCVVDLPDEGRNDGGAVEDEAGVKLTTQAEVFLRAIYDALDAQGQVPDPMLRLPANVRAVEWRYIKARFAETYFSEDGDDDPKKRDDTIRKAASRHGETLIAKRVIGKAGNHIWLTGQKVKGFRPRMDAVRPPRLAPAAPTPLPNTMTPDDVLDFVAEGS